MAKYVDGFVFVVPKDKVSQYKKMAKEGRDVWMKHGALEYYECVGEDLTPTPPPGMKHQYFPQLAKAKPGETVWFSFMIFKSRKHRDMVNKKVMDEMNEKYKDQKNMPMPFDMKRFTYGGFEVVVE